MNAHELGTLHLVRSLPHRFGVPRSSIAGVYELGDEQLGDEDLEELGFWWLLAPAIRNLRGRMAQGRGASSRGRAPRHTPGRAPRRAPRWRRGRFGEDPYATSDQDMHDYGTSEQDMSPAQSDDPGPSPQSDRAAADPSYADRARQLLEAADQKVAQVQAGISLAAQGAYAHAKGVLSDARDGLWQTYYGTIQTGATAAGDAIKTLAQRAGDAYEALGQGAGEAFRAFWGLSPSEGIGDVLVLGAVLLVAFGAAVVYVASTHGGQVYLSAVGTGAGHAIGHVGAGAGKQIGNFDVGTSLGHAVKAFGL